MVREILDGLTVPYIPMIGNHDVWPYDANGQSPQPTGDAVFVSVFKDLLERTTLETPSSLPVRLSFENKPSWNEAVNVTSYLQNGWMQIDELKWLFLDFNTRHAAIPGKPGALPNADLHDFVNGTWPYMQAQLAAMDADSVSQLLFFQHHAYRTPIYAPDFVMTFNEAQKKVVQQLLMQHPPLSRMFGVWGGHIHRWFNGTAFDGDEWKSFRQFETDACKGQWDTTSIHSAIMLVDVADSAVVGTRRQYGEDCINCPLTDVIDHDFGPQKLYIHD